MDIDRISEWQQLFITWLTNENMSNRTETLPREAGPEPSFTVEQNAFLVLEEVKGAFLRSRAKPPTLNINNDRDSKGTGSGYLIAGDSLTEGPLQRYKTCTP